MDVDGRGGSRHEDLRSSGDEEVVGVDSVGDGRVGDTVGRGGVEGRSGRSDGLTHDPDIGGTVRRSVGTSVSLSESRGGSIGLRVETWWRSSLSLARGKRVVGLVKVGNGHDKLTSHHIELVLTLESSGDIGSLGGTDSKTELVVRDERHPFLVKDVVSGRNVGSDISTDGVTDIFGTVRVELSSSVTGGLYGQIEYTL